MSMCANYLSSGFDFPTKQLIDALLLESQLEFLVSKHAHSCITVCSNVIT